MKKKEVLKLRYESEDSCRPYIENVDVGAVHDTSPKAKKSKVYVEGVLLDIRMSFNRYESSSIAVDMPRRPVGMLAACPLNVDQVYGASSPRCACQWWDMTPILMEGDQWMPSESTKAGEQARKLLLKEDVTRMLKLTVHSGEHARRDLYISIRKGMTDVAVDLFDDWLVDFLNRDERPGELVTILDAYDADIQPCSASELPSHLRTATETHPKPLKMFNG